MQFYFFLLIAFLVGGLAPLQGGINAQLAKYMNHPLQASFLSFLGGLILIFFILLVLRPALPPVNTLSQIPWYLYLGGIFGVFYVTTVLIFSPLIGITNMMAGALVGQLIMSVIIDHFGLFQIPVTSISLSRIFGILLLLAGFYLIQRK